MSVVWTGGGRQTQVLNNAGQTPNLLSKDEFQETRFRESICESKGILLRGLPEDLVSIFNIDSVERSGLKCDSELMIN